MNHSEIAHSWAHQERDHYDSNWANISYYGPTIYSYGSHFPMASMYPDLGIILFTTETYSNSTAKHLGHTRQAIDETRWEVLHVKDVEGVEIGKKGKYSHRINIAEIAGEVYELLGKQRRARKHDYSQEIQRRMQTLDRYIELFKCKGIAEELTRKKDDGLDDRFKDVLSDMLAGNMAEDIDRMAEEAEEKRKAFVEQKRRRDAEYVEEWKQGKHGSSLWNKEHGHSDLLRMKDGVVETSKGVRVEPNEAQRLWKLVDAVMATGEDRQFSGEIRIAGYTVNKISKNGDLRAGCHFLSGTVITEFVTAQGWNEPVTV